MYLLSRILLSTSFFLGEIKAFAGVSSFGFGGANGHVILESSLQSTPLPGVPVAEDEHKIAFLFSGEGSQYTDMGRCHFDSEPVFHSAILRCDELLLPFLPIPLLEVLYPTAGQATPLNESSTSGPFRSHLNNILSIDNVLYTQTALFAVQYAMSELWMSRGVCPDVVMGIGVGEFVAATVAGILMFEEAIQLIAQKACMLAALPRSNGVMVACRVRYVKIVTQGLRTAIGT